MLARLRVDIAPVNLAALVPPSVVSPFATKTREKCGYECRAASDQDRFRLVSRRPGREGGPDASDDR
jgi:hypothetical protein